MQEIYHAHLVAAGKIENDAERLSYLTSILRSLLQAATISIIEVAKSATPSDEIGLSDLVNRFCKPTDGIPLQIIDELLPIIRGYVSGAFLLGWFEKKTGADALSRLLVQWVEFRNKRPGHGVLDEVVTREWALKTNDLVGVSLRILAPLIPKRKGDGLFITLQGGDVPVTVPLIWKDQAIVILEAAPRKGIWKLKGQLLSRENADEFSVELPEDNAFSVKDIKPIGEYDIAEIISKNREFGLFHNIPVRQTDTFEGRGGEMSKLLEWIDDDDSRFCLVFGDGGYGKTTMVLEVFNQILESLHDISEPIPTIISFHTAKLTKWTDGGLVHLAGVSPVMDECIRELMRCFFPILGKEWYAISGRQLIDKAVGVLGDNKISRNEVLLIIDNTETLATTPDEVKELGAFFKLVGKLIGRIIITSRRREFIEATPIVIEGLPEEEAARLMRRLALECNAKPIMQAGDAKLRRVANQLMRKPVLIETLVKYIARSGLGIDAALENVLRRSSEELLEFLYEDAWQRINAFQKEVFFVLINVSCPLSQVAISRACQEIGIQHTEFQNALAETHFAVITDYGKTYEIELVELAGKFFFQNFGKLGLAEKERLKAVSQRVDEYAIRREEVDREYRMDRVAEAFRSEYAKAAKVCVDRGDIGQADELYKLAIQDDPLNSALHDRYSWFLVNKTKYYERARGLSERAVELEPKSCDAIVGLALVHYRLGDIEEGDKYIDLAGKIGRSLAFCLLRKAIARYFKAKGDIQLEMKIEYLEGAGQLLEDAERLNARGGGYDAKNLQEIKRYQDMVRRQLVIARTQRTKQNALFGL